MATVEIDESQLASLQKVTNAVQRMLSNPDSRRKILEAQKTVDPNVVIPELDVAKPFDEKINFVSKKVEELTSLITKDKEERTIKEQKSALEARWEAGRSTARQSGYTAEGLDALEKFMVEKGIIDHELAMPAFERLNPPATPVTASKQGFDIFQATSTTGEEMKKLMESHGEDRGALTNLISKTLSDVRTGGR